MSEAHDHLGPGTYVDSDWPEVIAFAEQAVDGAKDPIETAQRLYLAVRDEILYDPYVAFGDPESYRAGAIVTAGRGFCIPKAALLAAVARARGVPARVGFADVRNHLATPRLLELMGGDVFAWHGYTELWLDGRWVKATPAFNLTMCERFGVHPLDFDGTRDSMLHEFDTTGQRHMEYVRERGVFEDVPFETIVADFRTYYPTMFGDGLHGVGGDFATEAVD